MRPTVYIWAHEYSPPSSKHNTMVKKIDDAYRATDEYKTWLATALERYPALNQSLFDMALACHFGNNKAWREKKKFPHNPTVPPPTPENLTLHTVSVEPPADPLVIEQIEAQDHAEVCEPTVSQQSTIAISHSDSDSPLT